MDKEVNAYLSISRESLKGDRDSDGEITTRKCRRKKQSKHRRKPGKNKDDLEVCFLSIFLSFINSFGDAKVILSMGYTLFILVGIFHFFCAFTISQKYNLTLSNLSAL